MTMPPSLTLYLPTIGTTIRRCSKHRRHIIYIATSWAAKSSFSFLSALSVGSLVNRWVNSSLALIIGLVVFAVLDIFLMRLTNRYGKKHARLKRISITRNEFANLYQLATTGRIASGVFHDIANPLSCLILSLDEISDQNADHLTIERAKTAADRIHSSMTKIKKPSRPWKQSEPFNVTEMLCEVQEILIHKIQRTKATVTVVTNPALTCGGDRYQLERVCINLVSNALDALCESTIKQRNIILTAESTAKDIVLNIEDNGPGIPKHILKHILKPFFTTKKDADGSGLGLTVAQFIIEQEFQGKLTVSSSVGFGTKVRILLPK